MDNILKFADVMEAFRTATEARNKHDEAKRLADPYQWGYFGETERTRRDETLANAEKITNAYIAQQVILVLNEKFGLKPDQLVEPDISCR
jgi:hypothetical protein